MSSIPRHHAEWLSLLEISGPFLSLPVLLRVFPQGLDTVETERVQRLRAAHEEWADNQQGTRADPAIHTAWVRSVLGELGFGEGMLLEGQAIPSGLVAEVPEHGVTLRPDLVLVDPTLTPGPSPKGERGEEGRERGEEGRGVRMLIKVVPASQDLEKPLPGGRWQASVATQMMALLHGTGVRLGLVTNGSQWMLVHAPRGETTGFISWYAHLWLDEPLTLRAFVSLVGATRFFGVPEGETLEAMLAESGKDQHEVTDQLGYQVRQAVEILIRDLDQADVDRGRKLLVEVGEGRLYEAALTVMMRLVFLLSAEERSLLPLDDPFYAENYAVSTLRVQLRELADQQGEEVLSLRTDAWSRLLATFRAVFGGVQHERLRLIAYGGSLFDPDRFPFLEGRRIQEEGRGHPGSWRTEWADPLPVDNRTVLHLLEALQILRVKVPGGFETRRLSFRALDIEQIGHVYEGLLDHVAVRAGEPMLGLAGTREKEPEIPLARLEDLTQSRKDFKTQRGDENDKVLDFLQEETGRSRNALGNGLTVDLDDFRGRRLRTVCNNDEGLFARVVPFAGLVRDDENGFPVVIPAGSVYVTSGATRRATGTHYTPRSLTEPIVQHTLEPLVYVGPAEGLPKEAWVLRRPEALLALKICDMAMGSGAFLVQVVRYLAERLVEAWDLWGEMTEDGGQKTESPSSVPGLPSQADDKLQLAKRLIADRCLYGVDKNPLAVEMAKLSLWLITLDKNRPFTFLDHSLKCGDSLVGASEDDYTRWAHQLLNDPRQAGNMTLFDDTLREQVTQAREKRKALQAFQVLDVRDAARKTALLKEADEAIARVKLGCDLIVGVKLLGLNASEQESLANKMLLDFMRGELDGDLDPTRHYDAARALNAARKERAFHWAFEFPEVFEGGGFSAFVGNPPFIGGKRIREMLGDSIREILYNLYPGSDGGADIVAFFFLRAFKLLYANGTLGLIATNTIAQGDTRQTGLERIFTEGGVIYRAANNTPWPGIAAVYVSIVFISKTGFRSTYYLDEKSVDHISPFLNSENQSLQIFPLAVNKNKSFIGSFINGMGFILEHREANDLLKINPLNKDVLLPYLIGEDLNSNPYQLPSRWVINFFDWPLEKAERYIEPMRLVKDKVFPIRSQVRRDAHRKYWWQYGDKRPALYEAIGKLSQVLVQSRHTKYLNPTFVGNDLVFSDALTVFPTSSFYDFCIIQSSIHEAWARERSGSIGTTLRYTPSDCFVTYPFPKQIDDLEIIGEKYHQHRREIMLTRQEGLTATYNRFHDSEEAAPDIARLRALHVEMDEAVASAYGWEDLVLGHGFHETAQGVRFTISESARREVLGRLLALNHRRWEEEGG
ncbi:MAG: restriction endonuclease, partial [Anaerolineales bacterium]|nr:restriction endonuclease [Anaerolineales bacterium]